MMSGMDKQQDKQKRLDMTRVNTATLKFEKNLDKTLWWKWIN